MISQREIGELARFYTVTDPKKHKKGYTVYKVTARIISRKNPEDVQEITVWKRYSDFRKLHRDLWQIHKNLYRQSELFPPFAKAKVFGRFDESVIEERRQCSEDLLQFSANIPALYGSHYIQDFFKGGEVQDGSELIGPAEPFSDFLADSLSDCSSEVQREISGEEDLTSTSQSEYGGVLSECEVTSPWLEAECVEVDNGMTPDSRPSLNQPPEGSSAPEPEPLRSSRAALFPSGLRNRTAKSDYVEKAGEHIRLAVEKEAELDYQAAFAFYRSGVDLLLQGVQGEVSPSRREAVKRKTAEYLMRAEQISSSHFSMGQNATRNKEMGSPCCGVSWGQQSQVDELRNYRVLGVIDKVLLVMDRRTQETFILKGLRKTSGGGRLRRTIMPRSVPSMVQLRKYIITDDSVFLFLQYAEGGKLWSHVSKYLRSDTPDESFDIPFIQKSHTAAVHSAPHLLPELSSSSGDSAPPLEVPGLRGRPGDAPPSAARTGGSGPGEVGSPGRPRDSGANSSEDECTNSYLTLCTEYEQEKVEPNALGEEEEEEEEDGVEAEEDTDGGPLSVATAKSSRTRSLISNDSLCSPITEQELRFFTEDDDDEGERERPITDVGSLDQSKRSPMEFFRIDSKDSATEVICPDAADLRPKHDLARPFYLTSDLGSEVTEDLVDLGEIVEVKGRAFSEPWRIDCDQGSNESVPVISFKEAVVEDEGRPPDLLENLPEVGGVGMDALEEELAAAGVALAVEAMPSPKFGKPDVLQLHHDSAEEAELELSVEGELHALSIRQDPTDTTLPFPETSAGDTSAASCQSTATVSSPTSPPSLSSSLLPSSPQSVHPCPDIGDLSGPTAEGSVGTEAVVTETVAAETVAAAVQGERVRELFRQLDELALAAAQVRIPEELVRCWAAQMVLALESLHQEGIICRDLNPKNILLNQTGHVELTYFCSWADVEESCDGDAMANMYCAPEVGGICEETSACDWWSLGALLFELLTGKSLQQCHPAGISRHTCLNIPECVSEEARSLLEQLLQYNPVERLGSGVAGAEDIKSHPFFTRVDWPK